MRFYRCLPEDLKRSYLLTLHEYADYDCIFDIFDKINTDEILMKLINKVRMMLIDEHMSRNAILQKFNKYQPIVKYILDHSDNNDNSDVLSTDEHNDVVVKKRTDKKSSKRDGLLRKKIFKPQIDQKPFVWRDNQIKAWQTAIDSDFINGIHSQATGSGKSIIALKTIWEYHKKYPKNNILWICERKDIPLKLFFKKKNNRCDFHKQNYEYWKRNDIINMYDFQIIEHIYNKDKKWTQKLNDYNGTKPIFLIINRAFMTTRSKDERYTYRYEEIKRMPEFTIIDECHSSMANETYQLLLYLKFNRAVKIHGLSATPYRSGKSHTNLCLDIECGEDLDVQTVENEKKLLRVFCKQGNPNQLNLLSFFNLKDAIEADIILEPIFHWYRIDAKEKKQEDSDNEDSGDEENDKVQIEEDNMKKVLCVLDTIIKNCSYRKCIVWCGRIPLAVESQKLFDSHKYMYPNLSGMVSYIDHSGICNNDYDTFYDLDDNAILFCANKFREGSDIPFLSSCMFLDKVTKRGTIPFIQCMGRVLRKDDKNLKRNGHVLDGCVMEGDKHKMKNIVNKILGYYVHLYEISKSDFTFEDTDDKNKVLQSKVALYNQISQSIEVQPKQKRIIIKLNNDKKMIIDVTKINLSTLEWKNIIPKFSQVLKKMIVLSDHEEYIAMKKYCKDIGIKDKADYVRKYKKYPNLHTFDEQGNKKILDPKERFPAYFKSWYDFLGIPTHDFITSLSEWKKQCKKNKIQSLKDYEKLCEDDETFPTMPEEFYPEFTNLGNELRFPRLDTRR